MNYYFGIFMMQIEMSRGCGNSKAFQRQEGHLRAYSKFRQEIMSCWNKKLSVEFTRMDSIKM